MQQNIFSRQRHQERGQTILLVAISLVALLAMAALAIDVVTLYVASSQIQRATDAAALAGAKAIADSGFTSLPAADPNYNTAQTLAQNMATKAVNSMVGTATINLVSGQLPVMPAPPTFDFTTHPGSFQITVNLKSANLPTFFSKIWSRNAPTVTASATAEAYNPANLPTTTPFTPIAPTSVKPWLVANQNPLDGAQFVNTVSGTWVVDSSVIGKTIDLVDDCISGRNNRCGPFINNPPQAISSTTQVEYVPAAVTTPNTQNVCPACKGTTDYEQSIECADVATSYQVLSCGGGAVQIQWDDGINPGANGNNATGLGGECLINPLGTGQDILTEPNPIFSAPYQIKQQASGNLVTTSNSIVTIPILDTVFGVRLPRGGGAVTLDGFLQAFINQVDDGTGGGSSPPPAGSINITVLNIVGCSTANNGAAPVVGGAGTSPIPVRLITPP